MIAQEIRTTFWFAIGVAFAVVLNALFLASVL